MNSTPPPPHDHDTPSISATLLSFSVIFGSARSSRSHSVRPSVRSVQVCLELSGLFQVSLRSLSGHF